MIAAVEAFFCVWNSNILPVLTLFLKKNNPVYALRIDETMIGFDYNPVITYCYAGFLLVKNQLRVTQIVTQIDKIGLYKEKLIILNKKLDSSTRKIKIELPRICIKPILLSEKGLYCFKIYMQKIAVYNVHLFTPKLLCYFL